MNHASLFRVCPFPNRLMMMDADGEREGELDMHLSTPWPDHVQLSQGMACRQRTSRVLRTSAASTEAAGTRFGLS